MLGLGQTVFQVVFGDIGDYCERISGIGRRSFYFHQRKCLNVIEDCLRLKIVYFHL